MGSAADREEHDKLLWLLLRKWPLPEPLPSVDVVMGLAMRDSKRGLTNEAEDVSGHGNPHREHENTLLGRCLPLSVLCSLALEKRGSQSRLLNWLAGGAPKLVQVAETPSSPMIHGTRRQNESSWLDVLAFFARQKYSPTALFQKLKVAKVDV